MEFVGRVEAIDSVDLIARVKGFLRGREFAEGATVKQGQLLFRIEREPFEAAVAARRADVERAEATLTNACLQRERIEPLVGRGGATRAQLDEAVAAQAEATAARSAAQAALRQAEIDLGYTEIRAPFEGRIGRANFAEGAVVGPTVGPLARLVRLDPIFANIPITDRVSVQAFYPGANAEIVAETVASPIEAEVNGVDDMLYMTSTSDNSGFCKLDVTFAFGPLDYAMRIWLDPQVMTALDISEAEVVDAIRRQNLQAAAGRLGAPPDNEGRAFTYTLQAKGRLSEPEEFERILVRTNPDGSVIRLGDIARLDLGAQTYDADAWINGVPTAALGIYLSPGANALETADLVYAALERLAERLPDDLGYEIVYDTTDFVRISMRNVVITLLEALALVILVTYAFLGDWPAIMVPVLAIPGSIIGTFAVLLAAGLSINTVSMFAVILAIGIVVDDGCICYPLERVARA